MAAGKETITTKVVVKPEWDRRAVKKMTTEWDKTQKKLASVKMDWSQISRGSSSAVKEIVKISKAAEAMHGSLSAAAKASVKNMAALAKQLQETKKRAEELKRKAASAGSKEEKAGAEAGAAEAEKQMMDLTKQLRDNRKAERQHLNEIKNSIKARKMERDQLKKAASYTGKDFRRDLSKSVSGAFHGGKAGGFKGMFSALRSTGGGTKAGAKYSSGVSARSTLSGGSGVGAGLSKLAPLLSGLTIGFSAFIGFIAKASSAITTMNKTLIESTGTANDFTTKAGAYTDAIDDLRKSSKDATLHLLRMGGSVEQTSKIINSYMREASGSVIKTRDAMLSLGKGDTAKGVEMLARNAMLYGKALGMEATEVGSMMGKMENEVGLGAAGVQNIMSNITKAAATSNMPVFKFMDIFRSTTPALELYTNRMEELTGVIKMLSKNMSAADVKKYMDAFSKGFKGMSFEERVKHTLVAGVGTTNKILQDGFAKKAGVIADALGPELGDKFVDAFKKGDKAAMNDILVQAKASGVQASTIGEAQKLMGVEGDRKTGGALGTASASKGASMRETMKLFEAELTRLTGHKEGTRVSGIDEHVAEQRGMSQDMIDALNQYNSSMELYTKSLQEYGTTVSKSMDAALKRIVGKRMGKDASQVSREDLAKASRDEIEAAAELSNKDEKVKQTAEDLMGENVDATQSLGEKLENVIGFILEQIYESTSGILKVVTKIFNSILDWISGDSAKAKGKAQIDKYNVSGYGAGGQESFNKYKGALKGGVESGQSGVQLANTAGGFYKAQYEKMQSESAGAWEKANAAKDPEERKRLSGEAMKADKAAQDLKDSLKSKILESTTKGMHPAQAKNIGDSVSKALDSGEFGKAMEAVAVYGKGGDATASLLKFGQDVLPKAITDADRKAGEGGPMRRDGTAALGTKKYQKDRESADEASDTVSDLHRLTKDGTKATERLADATEASTPHPAAVAKAVASPAGSAAADAQDQQAKSFAKAAVDASKPEELKKATDDVYDGIHDVASLLKKGIRFETGFLNGPYSKAIRDSTLLSFKDALLEFGVLQARMEQSPQLKAMMANYGGNLSAMGGSAMSKLTSFDMGKAGQDPNNIWKDVFEPPIASKQTGGPIPDTGNYRLHRGEYVMPAVAAPSSGSGGGTVNATVNINGSQLTQQQMEHAVFNAMDKIARRP